MPFAAEWERILDRLLAKKADQRYADDAAVEADLGRLARAVAGERVEWPPRVEPVQAPASLSLAIVPFRAVRHRRDTDEDKSGVEVFCHVLLDAVTVGLSRLEGLSVVARTLTSRATRHDKALGPLGRQLFTDRLLTAAIERRNGRFLVVASLFDVPGNTVMWTGEFDVAPEEIFQLRDDIVRNVTTMFGLLEASVPQPPPVKVRNREAFELCLKGLVFWSRRYESGLMKALECFRGALALEPNLALAHAGLADTFSFLGFYSLVLPKTAFETARRHAVEAQRLDPGLAQAHTSLGLVKLGADWDWEGAKAEFREAIRLDGTQALARIYLSWALVLQGMTDEAFEQAKLAQDCDPTSPLLNAAAGYTFFLSRAFERAIAECEKALEIDEGFLVARYVMALCKGEQAGRLREDGQAAAAARLYREAIKDLEFASQRSGRMVFYVALLGKMYADTRETRNVEKAKKIIDEFEKMRGEGRYVGPHAWVYVYAGLRDLDSAFEWQAKAAEDGASPFNYLSPQLGFLHRDPRFFRDLAVWSAASGAPIRTILAAPPAPAGPPRPA